MKMIRRFFTLIWYLALLIQVLLIVIFLIFYLEFFEGWNSTADQPDRSFLQKIFGEPLNLTPVKPDRSIEAVMKQVRGKLPSPEIDRQPVLILPLERDREDRFNTILREAIEADMKYQAVDQSTRDQLLAQFRFDDKIVTDREDAIKLGKRAEAEVVIFGHVDKWQHGKESTLVDFTASAYQVADGKVIFEESRFTNIPKKPKNKPKTKRKPVSEETGQSSDLRLWLGLICFALFWPILLAPLTRKILDRESNALTAITLVAVIAVPVGVWWFTVLNGSPGVVGVLLLLCFTFAVALWTTFVMNQVAGDQTP